MNGEDILVEDGYGPITDVQVTSDVTEYDAQADNREWLGTQTVEDFSFDGTTYTVPRLFDETGDGLYAERVILYVTYTNGEQEEVVHRGHIARHYQVEGGVVSFLETSEWEDLVTVTESTVDESGQAIQMVVGHALTAAEAQAMGFQIPTGELPVDEPDNQ